MKIQNPKWLDRLAIPAIPREIEGSKIQTWKYYLIFYSLLGFGILMFGFCSGCARTVTQYVTYGDQMVVEVTLRGTMEASDNRYFMVLASSSNYKIPLPPPDNISYEFLEPGTEPKLGNIADYYTNYYSTWAGYIMVEPGGFFSAKGPFVQGVAISREAISSLGEITNTIKFSFHLSQIFGSSIPSTIYFDFVTVPWPADSSKLPADHLTSTNASVSKVAGSTVPVTDDENDAVDDALNILKCVVTIQ